MRGKPAAAPSAGHEPDSRVHRYDRIVGFQISEDEQNMINRNAAAAAAETASRNRAKQKSHAQTVRGKTAPAGTCFEFVNGSGHKRK